LIREELEGVSCIILKDLKAYYLKPPNVSWGLLFPLVLALAFTLRKPSGLSDLAPGLVATAALFGTTSMEAIVITFEKRVGALERLMLAPISLKTILIGKVLGGSIFGLMISSIMTAISIGFLKVSVKHPALFAISLILSVLTLSALGSLVAMSVKEVFEAQTLSNYFRFPMIFLCGVFLPVESMPTPLQWLAYVLPLTYSVNILRQTFIGPLQHANLAFNIVVLTMFFLLFMTIATRLLRKYLE